MFKLFILALKFIGNVWRKYDGEVATDATTSRGN